MYIAVYNCLFIKLRCAAELTIAVRAIMLRDDHPHCFALFVPEVLANGSPNPRPKLRPSCLLKENHLKLAPSAFRWICFYSGHFYTYNGESILDRHAFLTSTSRLKFYRVTMEYYVTLCADRYLVQGQVLKVIYLFRALIYSR